MLKKIISFLWDMAKHEIYKIERFEDEPEFAKVYNRLEFNREHKNRNRLEFNKKLGKINKR